MRNGTRLRAERTSSRFLVSHLAIRNPKFELPVFHFAIRNLDYRSTARKSTDTLLPPNPNVFDKTLVIF